MMKQYLAGAFFVLLATVAVLPAPVQAETSNVSSLLTLLQSLMKQVEDLQKQLATLKGDIQEELKDGLQEGMSDEDITKIQELLATDPTIYPRGLVTGYYGPMTKDAVKAFQKRYQLTETGAVDTETKAYMLEFFKERSNGKFPTGLLRAPGIEKKVRDRLRERDGKYQLDCDDNSAAGPLCKNKDKIDDEEEDEDEEEDDSQPSTVSSSTAATAIAEADDAIDALADAIDIASTTDEDVVNDAEKALAAAKVAFAKAETYYEDELYRAAYDYAVKAEKIADNALEDLAEAEDEITDSMTEEAIDDAEAAITNLKAAIAAAILEDVVDNDAIDEAEDALADAEEALATAKDDLTDEDFENAYESALEAEETAADAEEALDDAVEAA